MLAFLWHKSWTVLLARTMKDLPADGACPHPFLLLKSRFCGSSDCLSVDVYIVTRITFLWHKSWTVLLARAQASRRWRISSLMELVRLRFANNVQFLCRFCGCPDCLSVNIYDYKNCISLTWLKVVQFCWQGHKQADDDRWSLSTSFSPTLSRLCCF